MLFPTLDFALFFLAVFAVAWALRGRPEGRKWFLVAASYFFYCYWDWRFGFLLLASSLLNYAAALLIERTPVRGRGALVGLAVAINLGFLGYFKYYGFFIESLNDLMFSLGLERELPFLEIVLPIGISFYTFMGISYVVDVYRRQLPASRSVADILLYMSLFPHLVAGPIVRASLLLPQIAAPPDPRRVLATMGLLMIVMGLFKKVVVANYLATEMVDYVFLAPAAAAAVDLLVGIWAYAIQIYCDFSAYSDIAIGVAALLGFRFNRNFDQPYRARSLREFWQRWHISLSTWLRDYLYIPLGGNRGGRWGAARNVMITMMLGGIWHGAALKFLFWGFLHGAGLVVERAIGWGRDVADRPLLVRGLAIVVVFHFVCLGWIFFRAEDFASALDYLAGFARIDQPAEWTRPLIWVLLGIGLVMQFLPRRGFAVAEGALSRLPMAAQGALAGLAIVVIDALGPDGVAPFIYFQF